MTVNFEKTISLIQSAQAKAGFEAGLDNSLGQSLMAVFDGAVQRYVNSPAFSCQGAVLNFGQLDRSVSAFSAFLQQKTTLLAGDRIAIQLPNLLQYPVAVFGALKAGLVVVNVNPMYTARELEHQLKDSGAKAIIVCTSSEGAAKEVIPTTGVEYVIATNLQDMDMPFDQSDSVVHCAGSIPGAIAFLHSLRVGDSLSSNTVPRTESDIAVLQYTGGTTGISKGVQLSHKNLIANVLQLKSSQLGVGLQPGKEIVIVPLPLYHIYAFTLTLLGFFSDGQHSVLITKPADISGFCQRLAAHKFSIFLGLNTLFSGLCRTPEFRSLDFSHLKYTLSGGMALTHTVAQGWEQTTGCVVHEGYGLSEASPVVSMNPASGIRVGSIGVPLSDTLVKLVDDSGNVLAPGEIGELCVKGPQVMQGYWQRLDETTKTLSVDGWLSTGDMAYIDDDGYLHIADRKKDMVIVSGFNVFPNEVEQVVGQCAGVVECAVVGVPDEKRGEAVVLVLVVDDPSLDEEKILKHCREQLTAYKIPRRLVFVRSLPKSNVGKILRREIRDSLLPCISTGSE